MCRKFPMNPMFRHFLLTPNCQMYRKFHEYRQNPMYQTILNFHYFQKSH
jgi:hypothetical protein